MYIYTHVCKEWAEHSLALDISVEMCHLFGLELSRIDSINNLPAKIS